MDSDEEAWSWGDAYPVADPFPHPCDWSPSIHCTGHGARPGCKLAKISEIWRSEKVASVVSSETGAATARWSEHSEDATATQGLMWEGDPESNREINSDASLSLSPTLNVSAHLILWYKSTHEHTCMILHLISILYFNKIPSYPPQSYPQKKGSIKHLKGKQWYSPLLNPYSGGVASELEFPWSLFRFFLQLSHSLSLSPVLQFCTPSPGRAHRTDVESLMRLS